MRSRKFYGIFIVLVLMLGIFSSILYAPNTEKGGTDVGEQAKQGVMKGLFSGDQSILQGVLKAGSDGISKLVGAHPAIHGLIGGAISGFSTYKKMDNDISVKKSIDQVNISDNEDDYKKFPKIEKKGNEYDLYENRLKAPKYSNQGNRKADTPGQVSQSRQSTVKYENMVLADKNIIDLEYIETVDISEFYSQNEENKSPRFRLKENTKITKTYDENNMFKESQKRGILFTDKDSTIDNAYEYRYLVSQYKKLLAPEKYDLKLNLGDFWTMLGDSINFRNPELKENIMETQHSDDVEKEVRKEIDVKDIMQAFRLQFNSYTTDSNASINPDMLDCVTEDGMKIGTTGEEVLPKVAFDLSFAENDQDATAVNGNNLDKTTWCDVENSNNTTNDGIYCDSTQFTIEILNKINDIQEYVKNNSDQFVCPDEEDVSHTQDLLTDINNVGVTSADAVYDKDARDLIVNFKIEGGFDQNQEARHDDFYYKVDISIDSSLTSETKTITVYEDDVSGESYNGDTSFDIGYTNDPVDFDVNVSISDFGKTEHEENDLIGDNSLEFIKKINQDTKICNVERTSENIKLFARNVSNTFDDDKYVDFRANLKKDGYSTDFRKDFDDFYRSTFMQTPGVWYDSEDNGLYRYLLDSEKMMFTTGFESDPNKLVLPGPGRYEITLDIKFNDNWRLFNPDTQELVGDIKVHLNKEQPPQINYPVYYLPFDGLVGISTPNARQGYGVDYLGDVIDLYEDDTGIKLTSEPFGSSSSISTINVEKKGDEPSDFGFLNNGQTRGMIMSITTNNAHNNADLIFSPSNATPVVLEVKNQENEAYAFYKVSVGNPEEQGGEIGQPGSYLAKWTGLGECTDFTGTSIYDAYLNKPDLLAINSSVAPTTPSQSHAYGVEWREDTTHRQGSVFLYSILYTPQLFETGTGISEMILDSYSDNATLYTTNGSGNPQAVKSGKKIDLPSIYSKLSSLEKMYEMVKEKNACINYDSTGMKVYYNPKKVVNKFIPEIETNSGMNWIENQGKECIKE